MIAAYIGLLLAAIVCVLIFALAYKASTGYRTSRYQSMMRYGKETQAMQDRQDLYRFGLTQPLRRDRSSWQTIGLSFGTMALIGSAALWFGPAVGQGGLSIIGFGLPILALCYICVSSSLAEVASAMPTAGSLSHASIVMGGAKWGRRAGWFHVAGHITMLALFIGGCAYLSDSVASWYFGYTPSFISFLCLAVLIAVVQALCLHWGGVLINWLHGAGIWMQLLTAGLVAGAILWLLWPNSYSAAVLYQFNTASFLEHVRPESYLVGLLLLMKLFLGMDGAAAGAEETLEPRVRVPWAIYLSTAYTYIAGLILLTLVSLAAAHSYGTGGLMLSASGASAAQGFDWFVRTAMTGWGGSWLIAILIIVSLGASGLQSMSVCARIMFSLARDESIPCSRWIGRVSSEGRITSLGSWTAAAAAILLLLCAQLWWNNETFIGLLAVSIVFLHTAYAIPIGLRLRERLQARHGGSRGEMEGIWRDAPWHLGEWSQPVNAIAFCWLGLSGILAIAFLTLDAAIAALGLGLLLALYETWFLWKAGATTSSSEIRN
ncbi:amino acid permease [Paenibacillus sp. 1011MAR3C5]|uniref:amino acid permease n=1 Tax=Paenibacillus sp. 1011MAR3C5 TaxID=1675787 RepID=UPI000E6C0920|nr:amino acid permease [Paenibacillus sp. 1011MAR3C5]RJE90208.1 amino acid permease [Paenibacillus sp. 1011MAR3C5]